MLRRLFVIIFFGFAFLPLISTVSAKGDFATSLIANYKVLPSGQTVVENKVSIKNNVTEKYVSKFDFDITNSTPTNLRVLNEEGKAIDFTTSQDSGSTLVHIEFVPAVVGKDEINTFYVVYELSSVANLSGKVWELIIPKIASDSTFDTYTLNLFVPTAFGDLAFMSPNPTSSEATNGFREYSFSKSVLGETSVNAAFGEFQSYTFDLTYHLENPLYRASSTTIALPPDTAFQHIGYTKLEPKPDSVTVDQDGNWLAEYNLEPRQRVDVIAQGDVKLFPRAVTFFPTPTANLASNTKPTEFWQSDNSQISALAANLGSPEEIYNYVARTLKYDPDRVAPNVTRRGALDALANPESAICMEFTDTFIALARAAGIPAREVNGFAYTDNPALQPVGLVADVLHSWPEYWDATNNLWVPIDPTWGATSGSDYFSKLDLKHITFVIHGQDDSYPYPAGSYKLGAQPQKDVFVSLGANTKETTGTPEIVSKVKLITPVTPTFISTTITNTTPYAIYNSVAKVFLDDTEYQNEPIAMLPPFASHTFESKIPASFLGRNTPERIHIDYAGTSIDVPSFKTKIVVANLVILFSVATLVVGGILLTTKRSKHGDTHDSQIPSDQS